MAWNTPGSGSGNNGSGSGPGGGRSSWKPGQGGGLDQILARLRALFGAGGGGPLRWVLVFFVLLLAFSSFQLVGEQERGVVLRFGQFARIMQPGPNFKWPWPIETVRNVQVTTIGTWGLQEMPVLTNDENIVNVTLNVQYRINDPRQYLYGTQDADQVLQQAAQSAVREQAGRASLEDVLNKRGPLASAAKERLQAALDAYHTGMVVTDLTLPNARPPNEVKPAFDDVNSAQQSRERLVNEAQAYAARVVPEARGEAARTRTAAEGYKEAAIANAQGDADRFSLLQQQYAAAPETTRKRLWLETVEQVLGHNRKVVGGDGRQLIYVPMDPNAQAKGLPPASTLPRLPTDTLLPAVQSAGGSDGASSTQTDSLRPPRPTGREEGRP
ncbi:FtsH protease activity modulator HflK [Pseudoxanthomonas winnipegensis]|uniref:Protein HflK n=1 Tax=Pseudoxanthomonas winnipegensis TaxID=2480810 RepID=A0A4V2HGH1_9GAMM|nr:FtsH protease activity modulator HflK [Pseudoxanthomonas winnipegensis]TAA46636.1 FtsH protease activity modulator HflK [Pseudoxanthomonas winnipegensis]